MSTLSVTNLKNAASATNNLVLNPDGSVNISGGTLSPQTGFKNRIINGAMTIDQRNAGAAVTVTSANQQRPVDRFQVQCATDGTLTAQQSTTAPVGFTNSLLLTVSVADGTLAAGQVARIRHKIEGYNVGDLGFGTANASTITFSFQVRSSVTGTFAGYATNSASNRSYPFTYTINAANTYETKTVTLAGDTTGTWLTDNGVGLEVGFILGAGTDFNATANTWTAGEKLSVSGATNLMATNGATFYITGVQLEKGSTATPFEFRSIGQELALCQRYYQRGFSNILGAFESTSAVQFYTILPVPMRTAPTATFIAGVSGSSGVYQVATNFPDIASIGSCTTSASAVQLQVNISTASGNATRAAVLLADIFQLSSEL